MGKSCEDIMQKHKEIVELKKAGQIGVEEFTYGSFSGYYQIFLFFDFPLFSIYSII